MKPTTIDTTFDPALGTTAAAVTPLAETPEPTAYACEGDFVGEEDWEDDWDEEQETDDWDAEQVEMFDCPHYPACGCDSEIEKLHPGMLSWIRARLIQALSGNAGMSTTEYAIGTLSAAAFAALLYVIVSGDTVSGALEDLFDRALSTQVG